MKTSNSAAVELGKLSAKSRFKGLTKKERKEIMKKLWLKSLKKRGVKSKYLTTNAR